MLLFLALVGAVRADVSKLPFSLTVVPSKSFAQVGSITMAHDTRNDFYVVLTNTSKEPQPVWEYWNGWGYETISFELTTSDGKNIGVVRREQGFTRNSPSTFTIQPGENQVYPIRLNTDWAANPALPTGDEMPITLKAIYNVRPLPEAIQYKVWTGRVESHSYKFTLRLR